jgi:hypothetical protein
MTAIEETRNKQSAEPFEGSLNVDDGDGWFKGHRFPVRRGEAVDQTFTNGDPTFGRGDQRIPVPVPLEIYKDPPDG